MNCSSATRLVSRTVYGESQPNPEVNNLRGKVVQVFDQAGVVTSDEYDFKGNLLRSQRQLAREYKATLDWPTVPLEADIYTSHTRYDALNRPTEQTAPDNSVYRPTFNEANLLEKVDVNLRGAAVATPFVTDIDYNAKGQRTLIRYGNNGAQTTYEYDKETFRLTNLRTTRPAGRNGLASRIFANVTIVQDLRYTYDPVGNVVEIRDSAQQTHFYAGLMTQPVTRYAYDPLYRLVAASGREHDSLQPGYADPAFGKPIPHPNDANKLRPYTQTYTYDPSGNLTQVQHSAGPTGSWTRSPVYASDSNRLLEADGGFGYDAHGNMTVMPHQPGELGWDHADRLSTVHQADTIVVLENGKVQESGPHKTLLKQGGLYQKLYEYQLMP